MSGFGNPLWIGASPLILASKSSARQSLLAAARIPFEAVTAQVDERALEAEALAQGAGPGEVALALARAKALSGGHGYDDGLVIGADQTLALGEEAFHKPADREAAKSQLAKLAGRTHTLHSAIAVSRSGRILFETVAQAHLTMRPLEEAALDAYLDGAGHAVLSSVGAYQLEGLGIHLFERIEGDHSVILGLPLLPLFAFLRSQGVLL